MKLYDSPWAPSPRRVRIYLAEKGIEVPRVNIDLRAAEHLGADYLAVNPRGAVPALELDDGEVICESSAICRYFEALHPDPPLFGTTAVEIARIESWTRRIEQDGYAAVVHVLRNTAPAFKDRALVGAAPAAPQIPELAARGTLMWRAFVATLDQRLGASEWVAGDRFSFADITALITVDFAARCKLDTPEDATHLRRWHAAVSARPSAAA
ncbi:glutathione S-transferase [Sphingomonas sp. SFZ2018-12]|uniref:glutathione S-transferase family protein n=1 Tax=Sphingomonas sp. SFZ2018-12 TaxID=2683197 RepID=UPI001F0D965D|nr:glutathione S-transferase N-terminal domain-containing protein [Sphingomonas sp. SFZ2018-12]MCH4892786.1 glutathione S-transferase [Sphingomonas sp. SFZ2018-12]